MPYQPENFAINDRGDKRPWAAPRVILAELEHTEKTPSTKDFGSFPGGVQVTFGPS